MELIEIIGLEDDYENSIEYSAAIDTWTGILKNLMMKEQYAPITILAYFLPHQCTMVGCPLGDAEFKRLGEAMRQNPTLFAAAEKTGLLAEGIDAYIHAATENPGSWQYYYDDVQCIMENEALRKYISFSDRYTLEKLLSCGESLLGNNALWVREVKAIMKQLQNRRARGYA